MLPLLIAKTSADTTVPGEARCVPGSWPAGTSRDLDPASHQCPTAQARPLLVLGDHSPIAPPLKCSSVFMVMHVPGPLCWGVGRGEDGASVLEVIATRLTRWPVCH